MGVISARDKKQEKGPECPLIFISLMDKYRALKFLQRETGDKITIYPRGMLRWQDLSAYKEATGNTISYFEAELIMGIDAIFEGREDG